MELARGTVADRPWGSTLFGLAKRAVNGQLAVTGGEQRCCIAWRDGAIVGATTSFAADSVARIALTNRYVNSTQVAEIGRRLAANPEGDEIDLVAELASLAPQQADKLRHRVIEQRAARTFALEDAEFVLEAEITIPVATTCEIDVRGAIYLGAHMYLSEQRLAIELRQLGSHFTLEPESFDHLHRFGFTDGEKPILQALRAGTSIPELETVRELDPRVARAVLYALAACDTVTRVTVPRAPTPPVVDPLPPDASPIVFRTPTAPNVARTATAPNATRTPTAPNVARTATAPNATRTPTAPNVARTPTPTPPLSGVALARVPTVRASSPSPEADPALPRTSSRTDPARPPTDPAMARTPSRPAVARAPSRPVAPPPSTPRTITSPDNRQLAAEAYERGQRAIRAEELESAVVELSRACDLSPSNVDYQALLGWVRFCVASDKEAIVAETRKLLEKAIYKSEKPLVARFYLGRVERMVGREREALRHFHEIVDADPGHTAAASEIRILEARLAANAKR